MIKPIDLTKFKKGVTKNITGLSDGFRDPQDWISTGSHALNYLISGDFNKGIPLGKVTVFAGESGAGKSYIAAGNIIRNAQEQGIYVLLIDSENALDKQWMEALNVDTSEEKILRLGMSDINAVGETLNMFMDAYEEQASQGKVLIVIDSLGMLLTPTDKDQFSKGDMKGDMGIKAKMLTKLVSNMVHRIGNYNVGLVATNHTYASQDMFDPDPKISGGGGFIYASGIVVAMRKLKLKEDAEGRKITEVRGIRAACKVVKTRFCKPFEAVQIKIPYDTGMDPYSGLVEMFEKTELLKKTGNRLQYIGKDGTEHIAFRKDWTGEKLQMIMDDIEAGDAGFNLTKDEDEDLETDVETNTNTDKESNKDG